MLKTSKYTNIQKSVTAVDHLLQQIGPEIIEQSPSLKKLKLERERRAGPRPPGRRNQTTRRTS